MADRPRFSRAWGESRLSDLEKTRAAKAGGDEALSRACQGLSAPPAGTGSGAQARRPRQGRQRERRGPPR